MLNLHGIIIVAFGVGQNDVQYKVINPLFYLKLNIVKSSSQRFLIFTFMLSAINVAYIRLSMHAAHISRWLFSNCAQIAYVVLMHVYVHNDVTMMV